MKKIVALFMCFSIAAMVFTGCGRRRPRPTDQPPAPVALPDDRGVETTVTTHEKRVIDKRTETIVTGDE